MDSDDPPPADVAMAVEKTPSSPSQWDLQQGALALLERLSLLEPSSTLAKPTLRPDAPPVHLVWKPLVPIDDLSKLIAVIDPQLRPEGLQVHTDASQTHQQARQALLEALARLCLDSALTAEVIIAFRPVAIALVGRWIEALGLSEEGTWRQGEPGVEMAAGERDAVNQVWRAIIRALPILGDQVMPFLRLLLRHPLLAGGPPLPEPSAPEYNQQLGPALLTLHSLIHHLPSLPAISQWSLPQHVEHIMKTHEHRGTRLVAWRIVRAWLGLFAGSGEKLKRNWVWQLPDDLSQEEIEDLPAAPWTPYPEHLVAEYTERYGPDTASPHDSNDLVPAGFSEELVGSGSTEGEKGSRLVEGGLEVLVRQRGADPWILHTLENARMHDEQARLEQYLAKYQVSSPDSPLLEQSELGRTVVSVSNVLAFREGLTPSVGAPAAAAPSTTMSLSHAAAPAASPITPAPEVFVETAAHANLLRSLASNVIQRAPTLVTGTASSGKQTAVIHLWDLFHAGQDGRPTREAKRRGLVVINMADRSLDSKSLLGSLSSAPSSASSSATTASGGVGQFTFVEGPLTRAVRQGRWTLLLNIDQAAPELLSVIKVVAERMHTAASARREQSLAYGGIGAEEQDGGVGVRVGGGEGRWVKAAEGFMLFATRSVPASSLLDATTPTANFFASHFFSEAVLAPLSSKEVGQIVQGRYGAQLGRVEGLAALLVSAWEAVRDAAARAKDAAGASGGTKREVGVRDLLRWCRRVAHLLPSGMALPSLAANPTLQEEVFVEARDVFLGSLILPPAVVPAASTTTEGESAEAGPSTILPRDRFSVIARSLATSLGLSDERAEWALRRRVPDLVLPTIDTSSGLAPSSSRATHSVKVGRVSLPYSAPSKRTSSSRPYALTKPSLLLLEKLAVCLSLSEPVLLVGETGTGKTAAVGYLAELMGKRLTALNLSNQTEAGDLVGGFRPIDEIEEARRAASELLNRFVELFGATFSLTRNADFVAAVRKTFDKKRYNRLVDSFRQANKMAASRISSTAASTTEDASEQAQRKRRKVDGAKAQLVERWKDFMSSVGDFEHRHVLSTGGKGKAKFVFSFVEGPLAQAIRNGDWVLLDEVNLASSETLESLSTLLQSPDSSLVLTERGELEPIPRHPEFRLFACMNPATDVGKRDLPVGLRAKFSELWVPPPDEDRDALRTIVEGYIGRVAVSDRQVVADVAELYSTIKSLAMRAQLADGQNTPPHFSMRTLARALSFASEFAPTFGLRRSLYEGFVMAFTMLLDERSQDVVRGLVDKHIVQQAKNPRSLMERVPTKPPSFGDALRIHHYWLEQGPQEPEEPEDYILTPSVQAKVCDLARAVLTRKVPVLIQGPTSAGKTSVVEYLARRTGHRFVRINNHEHTDIHEYVGTYVSDPKTGKLVFQEGVLVRALRGGDWIVLDELNLAPTDVLEALNRLLDDNRELVIPETGEVVRPHPHFMLFATQNPPGLYGGRKVLSRAFRNRFLEMHFGDVPKEELKIILERRCRIAPSHAERTVNVFLELQRRRQAGRVFEQKQAFATLRDLFRWGGRGPVETIQQLAEDGYMLLAERARRSDDKQTVKEVLEEVLKVTIDEEHLYDFNRLPSLNLPVPPQSAELVWTSAMRRLYFLIAASLQRHEPVLLVGETGAGKTSVCQALAQALGRGLHIVGCHQNTETADLLGGQRPLRNRAALQGGLAAEAETLLATAGQAAASADFEDLVEQVEALGNGEARALADRMRATTALFEWHDGPLVQAMRGGDLILLDEISLADDSVLERLNSVLEPSRTLVLAEKGGRDLDDIRVVGASGFEILATMNPGGDFGKKELSPALRNRFTEIWVSAVDDIADLLHIIGSRWSPTCRTELEGFGPRIIHFAQWFAQQIGQKDGIGFGLRDILGWVDFLNVAAAKQDESGALPLTDAFCQGALMTIVDGLGALPVASGLTREGLQNLRSSCWRFLEELASPSLAPEALPLDVVDAGNRFSVGPYGVSKGPAPPVSVGYTLLAPTTRLNAMRVIRALQLPKPILLEGSPGVGKTSLVTALSAATGHPLVRINLSDQTDLMDLLGSDLPVEGGKSGEFAWKDAPFLAAMQSGDWVLLDEMNLASQSVLEGLNSCLDHRGTVYIPELDRTFSRHPDFRIFAAQNPLGQGGGRKGLPKSFLDRFSVVHMEELNSSDLRAIAAALFPTVDAAVLEQMIAFNQRVHEESTITRSFGMEGSPWEFNLRDVLRWLTLLQASSGLDPHRFQPREYVQLLYLQRFRNRADRVHVARIFTDIFGTEIEIDEQPRLAITSDFVQVGHSLQSRADRGLALQRAGFTLPFQQVKQQPLEALTKCLEMGWLSILTGARGSGKSTLVRQVAAYGGRRLREFTMNAEVDTLELLGSFEQADRFRDLDCIVRDVIEVLKSVVDARLHSEGTTALYDSLATLRRMRLRLAEEAVELDMREFGRTVHGILADPTLASIGATDHLNARLAAALSTAESAVAAARFEWIDGPLVQAMKNGDWLLIEDANLCSPSVLDRLNSLFETGGRLQVAERGPVNGEIQIIAPHPDFRLVMTLDPRNGELSRAMRNRGIEIAMLEPAPPATEHSQRALDAFREPAVTDLALIARLRAPSPSTEHDHAFDRHLISKLALTRFPLATRFLRADASATLPDGAVSAIRDLARDSFAQSISARKRRFANTREVPSTVLLEQPIDISLVPLFAVVENEASSQQSAALDVLIDVFSSAVNSPGSVAAAAAKAVKSLTVWDQSVLATNGRFKLDEAMSTVAGLYPLHRALIDLLVAALARAADDAGTAGITAFLQNISALDAELVAVTNGLHLDVSTIQRVIAWIAETVEDSPDSLRDILPAVVSALQPIRQALTLTSGEAMESIWRTALPYRSKRTSLANAYRSLLPSLASTTAPDPSVFDLALEVAVALGVPQTEEADVRDQELTRVVEHLVARLTSPTSEEATPEDEVVAMALSSNAVSYLTADLAATAAISRRENATHALAALREIARVGQVVSLREILPHHQVASWPQTERYGVLAATFASYTQWAEHLAQGLNETHNSVEADDILRPALLRKVIEIRRGERPSLGRLELQAAALASTARAQVAAVSVDSRPREDQLRSILLALVSLVVSAASDDDEQGAESDSTTSQVLQQRIGQSHILQRAADRYFDVAQPALAGVSLEGSDIAAGFVAFGQFLWHLYVPNLPLDPAIGAKVQSQYLARRIAAVSASLDVVLLEEVASTGNAGNAKAARLRSNLESLQRETATADSAPIERDIDLALLASLFAELRSFEEQIVSDALVRGLLSDLRKTGSASSTTTASRVDSMRRSIDTLLRRLEHAYGRMADILTPIRLALSSIKIGFSLLAAHARSSATASHDAPYRLLAEHLTSYPFVQATDRIFQQELPLSLKQGEAALPPSQATLLQIAALSAAVDRETQQRDHVVLRLTQLYERMHHLWATDRRHDEEAAEAAASLYKAKVDLHEVKTDEEIEAAEFAELFPAFDNGEVVSSEAAPAVAGSPTAHFIQAADQDLLARLHVSIFGDAASVGKLSPVKVFERLREAGIERLLPLIYDSLDDSLDNNSAAYRIRALVELHQVLKPSELVEAPHHDFYTAANVPETSKALPVLNELIARLSVLIDKWPEQMVLHGLRDRCRAVLQLTADAPVALVLTNVEQLLQQTEDWEKFADREHSISANRSALTTLIVDWRRYELACWAQLLSTVETRFGASAHEWWFRLYDATIRSAPGLDSETETSADGAEGYYRDLVALVNSFLSSSSLGQYRPRLELVLSFAKYARQLGNSSHALEELGAGVASLARVSDLLFNVYGFYAQYESRIAAHLASERARIDKEVQQVVKLASWKDINVVALRASAVRSHHQLFKSVRKLRTVLQKPASDLFQAPDMAQHEATPFSQSSIDTIDAVAPVPSLPVGLDASQDAVHLVKLEQTANRLRSLLANSISRFVEEDRGAALDAFSLDVISTAKDLRDTPMGPEEGREQRTKSLIERKKRAWRDLLNELKRIGISPSPSPRAVERLEDTAHTFGISPSRPLLELDDRSLGGDLRMRIERVDGYYFKALATLPELRALPAAHHNDIRTADVQRALGHIQSALAVALEHRDLLITTVDATLRFDAISARLEGAVSRGSRDLARQLLADTQAKICNASTAFDEARKGLRDHRLATARREDKDAAAFAACIEHGLAPLSQLQTRLRTALEAQGEHTAAALANQAELDLAFEVEDKIRSATEAISNLPTNATLRYLTDPLVRYLHSLTDARQNGAKTVIQPTSIQDTKQAHDDLISAILIVAQELNKASEASSAVQGDGELTDGAVLHGSRAYRAVLSALRPSEVLAKVERFNGCVDSVISLVERVKPFLSMYRGLCATHLASFFSWHKSYLKLSHVLASILKELAAEGFCRPAESDGKNGAEDAADGKTSEGTGMAEGSGAKNVSNEIEDESQLEGLQSDVPQEKREDEEEPQDGDDDAVEMNMDFDGDLEDRGDGEKDSGDEEDDDDEADQEEPEEQVADVDPLDPSSVDEKMWGDDEPPSENKDGKTDEVNQEAAKTTGEAEMGAKEDEQSADKPKADNGADAAEADQPEGKNAEGEDKDAAPQDDEAAGEEADDEPTEGDEAEADAEKGDRINEPMDESDKLDLPDDMKLDEEDDKASAGGEEGDLDGDLDLPDELPDMAEDGPDGADDEDDVDRHNELDKDAADAADGEGDDETVLPNADEAAANDSAVQDQQVDVDQAEGGAEDGEAGGEGQQDGSALENDPNVKADSTQRSGDQSSAKEADAPDAPAPKEDADAADPLAQDEDEDAAPPMATSASGTGPTKQRSQHDAAAESKSDSASQREEAGPPPQRSLGDSLHNWRRRLEEIGDLAQPEQPQDDQTSSQQQDGAVEYVQEGDEQDVDEQALGPANEEQVKKLEQLHLGEETAPADQMPIDHDMSAEPTDHTAQQPQASTVDLKGSTLTEADAKAVTASDVSRENPMLLDDPSADDGDDEDRTDQAKPGSTLAAPVDPEEDVAVEQAMLRWRSGDERALTADGVWRLYESLTRDLSFALTEQLRSILEPTLATRLKGDYRSGKRLNMKKIIPYIASEFTKDKIWLRRTRPSQREYQVLIAIDDSKSMADSHSVHLAFQSLALISRALTRLEVGGISVSRFGEDVDVLHPFEAGSVSDEAGASLINKFTFSQRSTDVRLLVERSLAQLAEAKDSARSGKSSLQAGDLWQLAILISDGMCQDHDKLRALLRRAAEQKVLFVFVVVDSLHGRARDGAAQSQDDPNQHSILAMKSVSYAVGANGRLELKMDRYIDSFGSVFPHYLVLRNADALPDVLSTLLRDFFASTAADR
ncbi:hypothetical protein JCM10908_006021 [Rhodotorula pacifica]|uniref:AAA family ATPase midasin n=1 Tax=Rhodotorula pacifica TaxID=1495444 RepID=UPI00317BC287